MEQGKESGIPEAQDRSARQVLQQPSALPGGLGPRGVRRRHTTGGPAAARQVLLLLLPQYAALCALFPETDMPCGCYDGD